MFCQGTGTGRIFLERLVEAVFHEMIWTAINPQYIVKIFFVIVLVQ